MGELEGDRRRGSKEDEEKIQRNKARAPVVRHLGPQTNLSAWVFCISWCAKFEFRVTAWWSFGAAGEALQTPRGGDMLAGGAHCGS